MQHHREAVQTESSVKARGLIPLGELSFPSGPPDPFNCPTRRGKTATGDTRPPRHTWRGGVTIGECEVDAGKESVRGGQEFIPPCNFPTKIDFRYCNMSAIGRSTQSGKNRDDEG